MTDNIRPRQIALAITDPDKYDLLRKIAGILKKAEVKDMRFKAPKKNCKHCYGRGFIGYLNGFKNMPVKCRCVFVVKPMGMPRKG